MENVGVECSAGWRGFHGAAAAMDPPSDAPKAVPMSKMKDSFLDGTSSSYLEELEERYRDDPSSVDTSWASFFKSMGMCMFFFVSMYSVFDR